MTEHQAAPSERTKRVAARRAKVKALMPQVLRVRVEPTSDAFRRALKHPGTGMKFPESGSAEWPLDTFTQRRLKDGCVQLEGGKNLAELMANRPGTLPTEPGMDNALPGDQPGMDNTLPVPEEPPLGGKPPEPPLGESRARRR
jgi:hypothetical protein